MVVQLRRGWSKWDKERGESVYRDRAKDGSTLVLQWQEGRRSFFVSLRFSRPRRDRKKGLILS